ncbi:MAG TPA: SRPBCC domain-containing protein [Candidatus Binataceae bacterium]|nr:SRPBCC domain-containing protein [Candidatus Binataceae bacterium]
MAATTNVVMEPAERVLVITRVFDAPRSLVFKAWTQPDHLMRWWGPRGYTTTVSEMDLRPGGAYRFRMRSGESIDRYWHGVVREIVEPERIVWTCMVDDADGKPFSAETVLTVTFEEHEGKTKLTLHQAVFGTVEIRAAHSHGWGDAMDRLAEYVASA